MIFQNFIFLHFLMDEHSINFLWHIVSNISSSNIVLFHICKYNPKTEWKNENVKIPENLFLRIRFTTGVFATTFLCYIHSSIYIKVEAFVSLLYYYSLRRIYTIRLFESWMALTRFPLTTWEFNCFPLVLREYRLYAFRST